jgi:hypothetical protein
MTSKLVKQVALLKPEQVKELADVMVTAGVAFELQGDWRSVFKNYSFKYIGTPHKLYKTLATLTIAEFERMTTAFMEVEL